ncbi:hypothetical protein C8R43DRAFT_965820 [Mycena crocata]|nr:hypothetical protein C8R43DRAFT_965820 [Mycena crocata]
MDENPPLARDGEREWDADLDCRVNWERSRTVQKSGGVVDHHMDENAPLALDGEREWDADLDCRVNWERSPQPHPDGVEELSIITWMKMHHSRGTASAGGMQLSTALHSFGQRKRAGIEYHMDETPHSRWTASAGRMQISTACAPNQASRKSSLTDLILPQWSDRYPPSQFGGAHSAARKPLLVIRQRAHLIHIQNREHAYKRVDVEGSVATVIQRLVCDSGRTNSTTASACTIKMELRYLIRYDALAPRVVAVLLPNPKMDRAVSLCFYHVLFLPLAVTPASLSLHPVDNKLLPASACTISHVDKVDTTISQERNSWEGVIEQGLIGSVGLFRLRLVFASPSSLDAFLFAVRFASNSATISVISRLLYRIPTLRTIMEAYRPMDNLPVEILAEIFLCYRRLLLRRDVDQVLLLGSVCRRWQAVAWDLKALWSKPHFKLRSAFFLQDLGDHMVDPWTQQMLAWLRRARDSKVMELGISVDRLDKTYFMVPVLGRFLPIVYNHLRVLQLELSQPQLAPLFNHQTPTFSHLETLILTVWCLDVAFWPWLNGLRSRAPKLVFLNLDGDHDRRRSVWPVQANAFVDSFPWAQLIELHINFFITRPVWRSIIGQCTSLCAGQFSVRCIDDPLLDIREPDVLPSLISLQMRVTPLCHPHLFNNLGLSILQLYTCDACTIPQMLSSGQCTQLLFLMLDVPILDHDLMTILHSQSSLEILQVYSHNLGARECRVIWTAHKQKYLQKLKKLSIGFAALHNFREEQQSDAMHWATHAMAAGWDFSILGSSTVTNRLTQILQPSFLVYPLPAVETIDMFDRDGRRWTRRFCLRSGISLQYEPCPERIERRQSRGPARKENLEVQIGSNGTHACANVDQVSALAGPFQHMPMNSVLAVLAYFSATLDGKSGALFLRREKHLWFVAPQNEVALDEESLSVRPGDGPCACGESQQLHNSIIYDCACTLYYAPLSVVKTRVEKIKQIPWQCHQTVKSKLLRMRIVLGEDIVQGVVNDLIHCVSDVLQSPERLFEEPTAPLNILLFALDDEGLHHLIRDLHDAMISFLKRQRVRSQRGSPSPAAETPSRHKCRSEPSVSARRRAGPPQVRRGASDVHALTSQPLRERSEVSLHIDTFICANMALAVLNVDEMRKRTMCASRVTKNGLRAVTLRVVDSLMED